MPSIIINRAPGIASAVSLSTQALAFDIVGRSAITTDPDWQGGNYAATARALRSRTVRTWAIRVTEKKSCQSLSPTHVAASSIDD